MAKVVKMKNDMFKNDQKETRHIQPTNCVNFFCFFFYIYYQLPIYTVFICETMLACCLVIVIIVL